jgi:flotillin
MSPVLIAIIGIVVLIVLLVLLILSRIKVAGPNQAFLVTGRRGPSPTPRARCPPTCPARRW